MSVDALVRLCAGSVDFHAVRSTSGKGLMAAEVAGLLAGLDPLEMELAMAKYLGDVDAQERLIDAVKVLVTDRARTEGWRIIDGRPCLNNIAVLAVLDVVRPNVCAGCGGVGVVRGKLCLACDGSGTRVLSGRAIARAIGVDEKQYRAVWKSRYQGIFKLMQNIDCNVNLSVLRNGLEGKLLAA